MDNVYGWEEVFAFFILVVGLGVIIMVGMTLFMGIVALCLVAALMLSPWIVKGFLEGWREGRS